MLRRGCWACKPEPKVPKGPQRLELCPVHLIEIPRSLMRFGTWPPPQAAGEVPHLDVTDLSATAIEEALQSAELNRARPASLN